MRVVGGQARGTKLLSVPGDGTRPILDRVKTSLFDILRPTINAASVLDMFAGSGSVGIEALSQGASSCVFLDISSPAITTIKKNLAQTKLTSQAEVRHTDCFGYVRNTQRAFDIIYVAPPQYKGIWLEALHILAERPHLLSDEGQIIIQIDPKEDESVELTTLREVNRRKYGNSLLVFYRK
jgi:16S rRNA (guanine966-N2)-methyltransferase